MNGEIDEEREIDGELEEWDDERHHMNTCNVASLRMPGRQLGL